MLLFVLTLVSILVCKASEAGQDPSHVCSKTDTSPIDNIPGCFDAVRLAADADTRWLSSDCCKAVRTLPYCLLVIFPTKLAVNTITLRNICIKKFPG
ncbi:hypothetical protein CARUB_v10015345mg [Capsella rubella]|uniref:Prolamin-like domain-containing protein n=2 Tax=Capsella rubella TaxID=81985 RepID=R0G993_9BRAS|nr:hypothetical protein CARUB_v10015345mg [Capsella rubella]